MKIFGFLFLFLAFQLQAEEVYTCNSLGMRLIKKSEYSFELKNMFGSSECKMESTFFPGTEVELMYLNCNKSKYYFSQLDEETIVLSKNIVFSKDINCKRVN